MKEFEVTETKLSVENGENVSRIDFMYDNKPGSYYKITGDKTDIVGIVYDEHDCIWGVRRGTPGKFGRMFDVPKYEDFISFMSSLLNVEIPTITYDTDNLVVYLKALPSKTDEDGISRLISEFLYNGIRGKYTVNVSGINKEHIIEYDGLKSVIREWYDDNLNDDIEGDRFMLPQYSDFIAEFKKNFDIALPTTNDSEYNNLVITNEDIKTRSDDGVQVRNTSFEYRGRSGMVTSHFNIINRLITISYDSMVYIRTDDFINMDTNEYGDVELLKSNIGFVKELKKVLEIDITYTSKNTGSLNELGDVEIEIGDKPKTNNIFMDRINAKLSELIDYAEVTKPTVNKPDNTKSGEINILNEKEEKDGGNIVVTFEFEYNGIKGICERTFNPTRNSTRMMYDGQSKEWGFYNNEWDAQSSGFTNPKYKEFIKAAEKAFSITFPYIRY